MNNVLITGAAGAIGTVVRQGLGGRYPLLRLSDIAPLGEAGAGEEIDHADLRDLAAVEATMDGIDAVVHLGGISQEADWQAIHEHNIAGTYNVFEAARRQGVSRVIFASSNHATGYHRRERHIGPDAELRPDSRYGVSKAFPVLHPFAAEHADPDEVLYADPTQHTNSDPVVQSHSAA